MNGHADVELLRCRSPVLALAEMPTVFDDVRFRGLSGHSEVRTPCSLMTQSGHQHSRRASRNDGLKVPTRPPCPYRPIPFLLFCSWLNASNPCHAAHWVP